MCEILKNKYKVYFKKEMEKKKKTSVFQIPLSAHECPPFTSATCSMFSHLPSPLCPTKHREGPPALISMSLHHPVSAWKVLDALGVLTDVFLFIWQKWKLRHGEHQFQTTYSST